MTPVTLSQYLWLRLMDKVCTARGHSYINLMKYPYCRRCYQVAAIDIRPVRGGQRHGPRGEPNWPDLRQTVMSH